jgi:hypothetical protein
MLCARATSSILGGSQRFARHAFFVTRTSIFLGVVVLGFGAEPAVSRLGNTFVDTAGFRVDVEYLSHNVLQICSDAVFHLASFMI